MNKAKPKKLAGPKPLVAFRADQAVLDAIDRLVAAANVPAASAGAARAIAIRQAILAQAARLDGKER